MMDKTRGCYIEVTCRNAPARTHQNKSKPTHFCEGVRMSLAFRKIDPCSEQVSDHSLADVNGEAQQLNGVTHCTAPAFAVASRFFCSQVKRISSQLLQLL